PGEKFRQHCSVGAGAGWGILSALHGITVDLTVAAIKILLYGVEFTAMRPAVKVVKLLDAGLVQSAREYGLGHIFEGFSIFTLFFQNCREAGRGRRVTPGLVCPLKRRFGLGRFI